MCVARPAMLRWGDADRRSGCAGTCDPSTENGECRTVKMRAQPSLLLHPSQPLYSSLTLHRHNCGIQPFRKCLLLRLIQHADKHKDSLR